MIITGRLLKAIVLASAGFISAPMVVAQQSTVPTWDQWRGPTRDGLISGNDWPAKLSDQSLARLWRVELDSSYSGPIVSESTVFVTGTRNKKTEVITALDRKSGGKLWEVEWPGTMTVPFFASSNGSWIRSTPAYDGSTLFVAGMCDVLVALDGKTGKIYGQGDLANSRRWRRHDGWFIFIADNGNQSGRTTTACGADP